jgi:hypothetical protein
MRAVAFFECTGPVAHLSAGTDDPLPLVIFTTSSFLFLFFLPWDSDFSLDFDQLWNQTVGQI